MPLSWNEIKQRAIKFSKDWEGESREHAEAKSFWDEFFNVFGIGRRRLASFEEPVKKLGSKQGFIDLFWKGNLIVEHKSKGKDLDKAFEQAIDYFPGLKEVELPKYILVSDFERIRLYDLEEDKKSEFVLTDLHKNIKLFGFIAGYQKITIREEDPINIKAAEKMGKLHDMLKENGYDGHQLEIYLVRLLFMLFADDTGIFEKDIFWDFIENHTSEDGSDLAAKLAQLFQVLNQPEDKRMKNLDEIYQQFPYINGKLFEESLDFAGFDSKMRTILIESCGLNWGLISPAIFGSLFQSIMDKTARRNLGAHYTSEKNIMKLIKPLFLDELWKEFHSIKSKSKMLAEFHKKLGTLKFLDPACGSGNFLIITYRELRLLELAILEETYKNQQITDIDTVIWLDIDQFYGIEIDEWAARIAEVGMWLIDHQMNMRISEKFGNYFVRIPLKKSVSILNGNSLRVDWKELVKPDELSYILGNPPFIGSSMQTIEQKKDMEHVFFSVNGYGVLDFVSAWFIKAAQYIQGSKIKVAFVSTNSISQGEQVGVLWNVLLNKYKIKIHFAHRTFKWNNEARGNAAVHVIITGFGNFDTNNKSLFDYHDINGEPDIVKVSNINPYLVDYKDLVLRSRTCPISDVSPMKYGSKPVDDGNLIIEDNIKDSFVLNEPNAERYIKPLISAKEYLNGKKRWCLWLKDIEPNELRNLPTVMERVQNVKIFRLASTKTATKEAANTPTLFAELRQPDTDFVFFPLTTSENRNYIPIEFFTKDNIVNNSCSIIPNATLEIFGILTSTMHMTWVKYTCGRLESRYRYSNTIVYNNYPFPKSMNEKQKERVDKAAQLVLDIRAKYNNSSLADLYDPLVMPPDLVKAHQQLDKAVDLCYRPQPFANERARIEFLFDLYSEYVNPLQAAVNKEDKKAKKKKK